MDQTKNKVENKIIYNQLRQLILSMQQILSNIANLAYRLKL